MAPYTFSWNHDAELTDSTASGLLAGSYTVTVTDFNNEYVTLSHIITESDAIEVTGTQTNVQCNNGNDGSIALTVTGGTTSGNYSYLWSSADGSGITPGLKDQTGLSAGNYSVKIGRAHV